MFFLILIFLIFILIFTSDLFAVDSMEDRRLLRQFLLNHEDWTLRKIKTKNNIICFAPDNYSFLDEGPGVVFHEDLQGIYIRGKFLLNPEKWSWIYSREYKKLYKNAQKIIKEKAQELNNNGNFDKK